MLEPNVSDLEPGQTWCQTHGLNFMVDEKGERIGVEMWGEVVPAGGKEWRLVFHPDSIDPRRKTARAKGTGMCEDCYRESQSTAFVQCPVHGLQPVNGFCPCTPEVATAVAEGGAAVDAPADEVGAALSIDGLDELDDLEQDEVAAPPIAGSGADGEGARSATADVPRADGASGGDPAAPRAGDAQTVYSGTFTSSGPVGAGMQPMWGAWTQPADVPKDAVGGVPHRDGEGAPVTTPASSPAPVEDPFGLGEWL